MLVDSGCKWVIVGHSERRQHFAETDAFVAEKVAAALRAGLDPIVCVGETLGEREEGWTLAVIERQVRAFLSTIASSASAVAIAYEPVWAIGTGKNAGPAEAQDVHQAIRTWLVAESAGHGGAHAHPLWRFRQNPTTRAASSPLPTSTGLSLAGQAWMLRPSVLLRGQPRRWRVQ